MSNWPTVIRAAHAKRRCAMREDIAWIIVYVVLAPIVVIAFIEGVW